MTLKDNNICGFTIIITHTHTNSCLHLLYKGYEIKISYGSIQPCFLTSKFCTIIYNQNIANSKLTS